MATRAQTAVAGAGELAYRSAFGRGVAFATVLGSGMALIGSTVVGRLDLPGAALVSVGLAGLAYGLTDGAALGWASPATVGSLLAGLVLVVVGGAAHGGALAPRQRVPLGPVLGGQCCAPRCRRPRLRAGRDGCPLKTAVPAAAPGEQSGIASAVNNDVARAAELIAVTVLPSVAGITGHSYLHPSVLSAGFHRAVLAAAGACVAGGLLAVVTICKVDVP